ncbi:hypothetical protein [Mycolicibacterium chitae]|nr:hypothetical protein [Mycolicibacterium chitae]MCV7108157.1 hypothetical protein [Mycolicibacterium chitae]
MSNPPYGGMPPAQAPWPPQGPPPARQSSRLPLVLTAALAVIAIIIAIASWFQPAPEPEAQATEQQFSEQEVTEAKEAVCGAWDAAYNAIQTAASRTSNDETIAFILAVEVKLAFHASGDYIESALRDHSATENDLAEAARQLSSAYHRAILFQLADEPSNKVDEIKSEIRAAESTLKLECE